VCSLGIVNTRDSQSGKAAECAGKIKQAMCTELACRRYGTSCRMFLRSKDLAKVRVGILLSLLANTRFGLVA
jgi:hypothetical protein